MFMPLRAWLLAAALIWPLVAHADPACDGRKAQIVAAAWPDAPAGDDDLIIEGRQVTPVQSGSHGVICRRWPANPHLLLAAVPMMRPEGSVHGYYDGQGDLELLVLDHASLAIQARLRLADFILEDAIYLGGLRFDTAPYRLFDGRLAFGIRRDLIGSSRPNPFSQTDLSLFDLNGATLRPVLQHLVMAQSFGDWDTTCTGQFEALTRLLQTGPGARNGGADLVLRGEAVTVRNTEDGDTCAAARTVQKLPPFTLHYDGARYPLQAAPPPSSARPRSALRRPAGSGQSGFRFQSPTDRGRSRTGAGWWRRFRVLARTRSASMAGCRFRNPIRAATAWPARPASRI